MLVDALSPQDTHSGSCSSSPGPESSETPFLSDLWEGRRPRNDPGSALAPSSRQPGAHGGCRLHSPHPGPCSPPWSPQDSPPYGKDAQGGGLPGQQSPAAPAEMLRILGYTVWVSTFPTSWEHLRPGLGQSGSPTAEHSAGRPVLAGGGLKAEGVQPGGATEAWEEGWGAKGDRVPRRMIQ